MKHLVIFFSFFILTLEASSQSFYKFRRGRDVIASAGTGTTSYFGDLNDEGDFFDPKPNFNIGLQYFFTTRIAARAELLWFQLEGDDSESSEGGKVRRNLSFISNNFELNVVGIIQAFPNGTRYYQRPTFNVYGFAGIGLLYFNPQAELNGNKYALQPIQTEGVSYSRTTIVIPYGIGIKYKINPFFNIVLEGGFRQTFTDYIDDVSDKYVDNSSFSDPIHAQLADRRPEIGLSVKEAGSKRGNPENNDNYFIYNFKLEFFLPNNLLSSGSIKSKRNKKIMKRRKRRR